MTINTYAKTLFVAKSLLDLCHYTGYPNITPLKIVKLTYITHGWTLGMTGKPLLDEPAEAWKYGLVIPSLFHVVKLYGDNPIDDIEETGSFDPLMQMKCALAKLHIGWVVKRTRSSRGK